MVSNSSEGETQHHMEHGFLVLFHWTKKLKALVSVKKYIEILIIVLNVVSIKVTKMETVTEHAKTD